jgi:hypothetical protein
MEMVEAANRAGCRPTVKLQYGQLQRGQVAMRSSCAAVKLQCEQRNAIVNCRKH